MSADACQGSNCGATDGASHSAECITEAAKDQGWDTKVAWTAIDQSNPATLPPRGDWLVTVETDYCCREVHTLDHRGGGHWLQDGEFISDYSRRFRPIAWAAIPAAYDGAIPEGDE